ncbi:MAG TPA: hypothetical protein EYQ74_01015 [Planctomycetes bacterium]|nr:hypothetical protein [Planctomycetota bacterium]HIK59590.1 hypothetical protein [Planctomycetota bacterium]
MKLTVEWMSQLRVAAGSAQQLLDCPDGTRLTEALEQALAELPPDRALALRPLLLADEGLSSTLLIAVDGVQVPCGTDPELTAGATVLLSSPIAGG